MKTTAVVVRTLSYALVTLLCMANSASAQLLQGAAQFSEVHHDESIPLRDMPPAPRTGGAEHEMRRPVPLPRPPFGPQQLDPVVQSFGGVAPLMPTTLLNMDGVGEGFSGPQGTFTVNAAPPDTNGAVGPNHYVQTVNTDFAVFSKAGTPLYGPVPINTLWSGFGGGCQTNNDGDPIAQYDRIADRFIILQFSVTTTPYLMCVAVSQTSDPTGAYYRYSFNYGNVAFPDYPKLGVWPDGYYMTVNVFNNGTTFAGTKVCAFDRAKMLTGAAATQQCFNTSTAYGGLLPSDLDGPTAPPAGSPNYLVALGATTTQLAYWKFHVDWATPANSTFTGPTSLAVASYAEACSGGTCIPQSGTTQKLDSLADRLMYRLAYRNFGTHESLVVNHSVTAGSSVGVRWYELRTSGGNLTLFQQGTYAPDTNYRWMGSIAMDGAGNIGLGYSVSSGSLHPQIHYTGRLAADASGTMTQGEGTIINGAGSQSGSSLSRWGDYSSMSIDPLDDCTFWYATEYLAATGAFNWHTRIASFKFPSCGSTGGDFTVSATPASRTISVGQNTSYSVTITPSGGFTGSVNLSVTGLPSGASGTFTPNPATTSSSLDVTTTGAVAPGTYNLTITGVNGSLTHTASVSLTINAVPDFSLTVSPTSQSVIRGQSGAYTVSVVPSGGFSGAVNFSVTGLPAATTASFSPNPSATTSTLTVNVGASAPVGTRTLTITGTNGALSHTATASLVITKQPTTTVVTSSLNPSTYGQAVTFTATVSSAIGAPPNGQVITFKDGTLVLGTGTLSGGVASLTTAAVKAGTRSITATYPGDTTFAKSVSAVLSQKVNKASTATSVSASPNPSTAGQVVTFTATVTSPSGLVPTGKVNFKDGTTLLGSGTLDTTGQATFSTSTLAVGSHTIKAVYVPSPTNFAASTSAALTQVVN